jgi:hypothetical protein
MALEQTGRLRAMLSLRAGSLFDSLYPQVVTLRHFNTWHSSEAMRPGRFNSNLTGKTTDGARSWVAVLPLAQPASIREFQMT